MNQFASAYPQRCPVVKVTVRVSLLSTLTMSSNNALVLLSMCHTLNGGASRLGVPQRE